MIVTRESATRTRASGRIGLVLRAGLPLPPTVAYAAAGEERNLRSERNRPVSPEVSRTGKACQRKRHFAILRRKRQRGKTLSFCDFEQAALRIYGRGCLSHGRSVHCGGITRDCCSRSDSCTRRCRIIYRCSELDRAFKWKIEQLLSLR